MLESYIAPLLMGYVDKYVLNLKPTDLSLSVWGGDVVLHNLELNLPLLQKELNLPIHFLSGKIHKLQIHVPWTKLIYEPVTININTMEFIVTLKEFSSDSSSNKSDGEKYQSDSTSQSPPAIEDDNLPPGYVQSILNKVINNVTFKIENIILKYVEDDIVFSVNVKSVEIFSADSSWSQAFTELSLPELVLRKICNLTDVTICLDRQSSNGRIDVYQDPILYKSSISCRIVTKYNSLKGVKTESTNCDVFCESLDFSITDQQIPLLLRLLMLVKGLFYGTLDLPGCEFRKHSGLSILMAAKKKSEGMKNVSVEANESLDTSWSAWAWSFLPGQEDQSNYNDRSRKPESKHFRTYVAQLTVILKKTTQMSNTLTSQRLEFTPILCIEVSGFLAEFISIGQHIIDFRCGVEKLTGYSFGNQCVCTPSIDEVNDDTDDSDIRNVQDEVFVSIGNNSISQQPTFLQQSLFAEQESNLDGEKPAFNSSTNNITEEDSEIIQPGPENTQIHNDKDSFKSLKYLEENNLIHECYGSIFLSYFYEMELPDNKTTSEIENIFLYPEKDEIVGEVSSKKLMLSQCNIYVTSSLKHIIEWLTELLLLDIPQRAEKTEVFLDPFCMQQLEMGNFLSSSLNMIVTDFNVYIHTNDHIAGMFTDAFTEDMKRDALFLQIDHLDLEKTDPMYPTELTYLHENQRLVKLHKLENLHSKVQVKVMGVQSGLMAVEDERCQLLCPLNLDVSITLPIQSSREPSVSKKVVHLNFNCEEILLAFQKIHPLLIFNLSSTWFSNDVSAKMVPQFHQLCSSGTLQDESNWMKICINSVNISSMFNQYFLGLQGSVASCAAKIASKADGNGWFVFESPSRTVDLIEEKNWNTEREDMANRKAVDFKVQLYLKDEGAAECVQIFMVDVAGAVASIDKELHDWFSCAISVDPLKTPNKKTSVVSKREINRSVSSTPGRLKSYARMFGGAGSNRSLSVSSKQKGKPKKDSKIIDKPKFQTRFGDWFIQKMMPLKGIHLKVHIDSLITIFSNNSEKECDHEKGIVQRVQELKSKSKLQETLVICLPEISLESAKSKTDIFDQLLPLFNKEEERIPVETLPWTVSSKNFTILTLAHEDQISRQKQFHVCKPISWTVLLASVEKSKRYTNELSTIEENENWDTRDQQPNELILTPEGSNSSKASAGFVLHMHCSSCEWIISQKQVDLIFSIIQKISTTYDEMKRSVMSIIQVDKANKMKKLDQTMSVDDVFSISSASTIDQIDVNSTITESSSIFPKTKHEREQLISLWLQCTIPKIKLTIMTPLDEQSIFYKVASEIEEIMFSFDYQDSVVNFTNKVAACVVAYSLIRVDKIPEGWVTLDKGYLLCQKDLPHESIQARTFLSINYTRTHHYVNCLVANQHPINESDDSTNISNNKNLLNIHEELFIKQEVSVQVLSFDLFINLKPLLACLKIFKNINLSDIINKTNVEKSSASQLVKSTDISPLAFPRVAVIIECFRIFVPREKTLNSSKEYLDNEESNFLMSVNSITLGSTPDNPLTKTVVNKPLYRQIKQTYKDPLKKIKLWNIQYQLTITNASLCTTNWHAFEDSLPDRDIIVQHNPALAWNQKNNYSQPLITPIFPGFDIKLTIAPPVIGKSHGNLIPVTGAAIELHSPKEMRLYLNTSQVGLFEEHLSDANLMLKEILGLFVPHSVEKIPERNITSTESSMIPMECFASVSNITIFFSFKEPDGVLSWNTYPLCYVNIQQPTLSINTCREKHAVLNVLDLQIKGSSMQCKDIIPSCHDFDKNFFICNVEAGNPLPNMLFKFEARLDERLQCSIDTTIGQPFTIFYETCLQNNIFNQYKEITETFFKLLDFFNPTVVDAQKDVSPKHEKDIDLGSTLSDVIKIKITEAKIETNGVAFCLITPSKARCHLSVNSIKASISLNDYLKPGLMICGDIHNVQSHVTDDKSRLNVLCPTNINFSVDSFTDTYRNIQANISLNIGYAKVKFSKCLLEKVNEISKEVSAHFESVSSLLGLVKEKDELCISENVMPKILLESKDDLRSGLLDYVIISEKNSMPLVNTIYFYESQDIEPSCLTWRYREAREITSMNFVPVPFHLTEDARNYLQEVSNGKIPCCLEYFNQLTKTFDVSKEFEVSESETLNLDMKSDGKSICSFMWKITVKIPKQLISLNDSDFPILPVTSLAACIALDSRVIQQNQMNLKVNLDVLLFSITNSKSCSVDQQAAFKSFFMDKNPLDNGELELLCMKLQNTEFCAYARDAVISEVCFETAFQMKLMDFNDYLWMDFIKTFSMKSLVKFNSQCDKITEKCKVNIDVGNIHVNICQSTLLGIQALINEWNESVTQENKLFNHYVFCNETQDDISFKQDGTDECITLKSGRFYPFSWYGMENQKLLFTIASCDSWTEPVDINQTGITVHVIEDLPFIWQVYVDIKEINSLQKQIEFHGCCAFENKLSKNLAVEVLLQDLFVANLKALHHAAQSQLISTEFVIPNSVQRPSQCLSHSLISGMELKLLEKNGKVSSVMFADSVENLQQFTELQRDNVHCWLTTSFSCKYQGQLNIKMLPPLIIRNHMYEMVQFEFHSLSKDVALPRIVEVPGKHGAEQVLFVRPDEKYNLKVTLPRTQSNFFSFLPLDLSKEIKTFIDLPFMDQWPFQSKSQIDLSMLSSNCETVRSSTPCFYNTEITVCISKSDAYSPTVNIDLFAPWIFINESQINLLVETLGWKNPLSLPPSKTTSCAGIKNQFKLGTSFAKSKTAFSEFIVLDESRLNDVKSKLKTELNCVIEGPDDLSCHLVATWEKIGLVNILRVKERFKIHNLSSYDINIFPIASSTGCKIENEDLMSINIIKNSSVAFSSFVTRFKNKVNDLLDQSIQIGFKLLENAIKQQHQNELELEPLKSSADDNESGYESVKLIKDFMSIISNVSLQDNEILNLSADHFREVLHLNYDSSIVTMVTTSVLEDGVINIFIDVEKYPVFKFQNHVSSTFGLLPLEKHAGSVFRNFNVLLEDTSKLHLIKPLEDTTFTSKIFFKQFPKLTNEVQLACQFCIQCEDTIELSSPFLLQDGIYNKKLFIPGFGEVFVSTQLCNSQLVVRLTEAEVETGLITTKSCRWPQIELSVSSIHMLLIDFLNGKIPSPLLSIIVANMQLSHSELDDKSLLQCKIGEFRLENQLKKKNYHFPVILLPLRQTKDRYKTLFDNMPFSDQETEVSQHVLILCDITEDDSRNYCIDEIKITLEPSELYIEDTFIYDCYSYFKSFISIISDKKTNQLSTASENKTNCIDSGKGVLYPVKICKFTMNEISVLVSFHVSLKMYVAANHIPLVFGAFHSKPTLTVKEEILRALLYHYATQTLVSTGWIIGSFEILGNPTGLLHNVGRGISDALGYPYQGIIRGPSAFVSGIGHGVSSFFKHISKGALLSINNVSSSLSRNIELLSFDELHQSIQEEYRLNRAANASQGFNNALQSFGISLLGAIAGIVDHPFQNVTNAESTRDALVGVVSGFAKGFVGVLTKPVSGAMEFISQTSHNILQTSGLVNYPSRAYTLDSNSVNLVFKSISQFKIERQWSKVLQDTECLFIDNVWLSKSEDKNKPSLCVVLLTCSMVFIYQDGFTKIIFPLSEILCTVNEKVKNNQLTIKINRLSISKAIEVVDTNPNIQYYFESFEQASVSCHNEAMCNSNISSKDESWFLSMKPAKAELFMSMIQK